MEDLAFGPLLRRYRRAAGLSQEALAERAGLSSGAISTLERSARRGPQQHTVALLAHTLALEPDDRARLETAAGIGRRRGPARMQADGLRSSPDLPLVLTSLHGRAALLADLEHLIAARRLVTLVGAAGVGKTRAALETAHAHGGRARFCGGVWFADLAPVAAPELVVAALARLFGVRRKPGESLFDALLAALRAKRILLVLDNCEHVVDACAEIVETLLRTCPGVVVLVTSREALRVDGECVLRVAPLAFDGDASPALEMLVDRLADADFVRFGTLSREDRSAALRICARLDGIPLALEIAARRAHTLSLVELEAGLDMRFTLLPQGRRTARSRSQTLAGMIDSSFNLLAPAERRLFTRLGIFATSFSRAQASEVWTDGDGAIDEILAALVGKSLVTLLERDAGPPRYRLLETVRAYALDRMRASSELEVLASRFTQFALPAVADAPAQSRHENVPSGPLATTLNVYEPS